MQDGEMDEQRRTRHIISISGGKDSAALAIYLKDRIPELEYVFCDTGAELPETYEYLDRLEAYLGRKIVRLRARTFEDALREMRGFLPSPNARWCTRELKIKPFEQYIGDDIAYNYIAIRADEQHRKGYISKKPNIIPRYPFIEDNITKDDVIRILEQSGLGLPAYYRWRSRSGCYLCFFQRRIEWIGLLENHPELFWKAASFERIDESAGMRFTWSARESLAELARPERIAEIKRKYELQLDRAARSQSAKQLPMFVDDSDDLPGCLICHL